MSTLFLAANGGMQSNNVMMIILFVILIGFTYFGMIRPQKKQQQKRMEMMDQLKKGDRVVLVDGLHAKIDSINAKDQTVVVDADGIYLTFSRMAVRQILPSSDAKEEKPVIDTAKDVKTKSEEKTEKPEDSATEANKDTNNSEE